MVVPVRWHLAFAVAALSAAVQWGCTPEAGVESAAQTVVGVAEVDITPDHPIRLSGYAGRKSESTGVQQRIRAKAIALGTDVQGPALLVSFETCVIPNKAAAELASRLEKKANITRERLVLCCTHTHSAPHLAGGLPNMFGEPVPPEHQASIDRYTSRVGDELEKVALMALANRKPAQLSWAQGQASFARNRRLRGAKGTQMKPNPAGPVDHSLPVLRVTDPEGRLVAVLVNYACHCTTLGGDFTQICGDWAGYAQESVEAQNPGATCMVVLGCGADANPEPRLKIEHAQQHGETIAAEVARLLQSEWKPLRGVPVCRFERIHLPFAKVPSRQEWEARLQKGGAAAYQARLQLEGLDRGEGPGPELGYPVQTWVFGSDLAMVFLAGEVVSDYSLRLKSELGADRLWVTAYANEVPCYIPSRRVLGEGGYEADDSMIYYNQPSRFAPEVEELIVGAVRRQLEGFRPTLANASE